MHRDRALHLYATEENMLVYRLQLQLLLHLIAVAGGSHSGYSWPARPFCSFGISYSLLAAKCEVIG